MKKYIAFLIIILFFSCTAKKTSLRSRVDDKISQKNEIADVKKSQTEVNKTVVDQSNSDIVTTTKTTIYDTDKPKDKDTGKPPIKAEIVTTQKKAERNDVKTDIDFAQKEESSHKNQSKVEEQVKADNKSMEKTKPPDVKYYFYILAILLILIAGFLVYRNLSRIKTFFKLFL